jgi:hypothetical protein
LSNNLSSGRKGAISRHNVSLCVRGIETSHWNHPSLSWGLSSNLARSVLRVHASGYVADSGPERWFSTGELMESSHLVTVRVRKHLLPMVSQRQAHLHPCGSPVLFLVRSLMVFEEQVS